MHIFEQVLAALLAIGFILAISQAAIDSRSPIELYFGFACIQVLCGMIAVYRKNLLASTLGFCFTVVLLIACALERATFLPFDASLTSLVYRSELISTAYSSLLACTCAYWLIVTLFSTKQDWTWLPSDFVERTFARKFAWIALWSGVALTALTTSAGFIADKQYGTAGHSSQRGALADDSGLALLAGFLLVIAMVSAVRCWGYHSNGYRLFVAVSLCTVLYFRWFRGQRASSLPVFLTIIFLFHLNSKIAPWKKVFGLTLAALVLVAALNIWARVRNEAAHVGTWNAVSHNLDAALPDITQPLSIKMLPQSYWHLLHTIDLYQTGVRLNGTSFIDLVPQSIPDVLAKSVGYQRPLSGPVRLYDYRIHGGGMFIIAEGYWNFGMLGALLVSTAAAFLALKLEEWFRRQEAIVVCTYFATIGTVGFGTYYGLQTFVKSIEIALVLALAMKLALAYMRKRYEYRARLVAAHLETGRIAQQQMASSLRATSHS
jgi:hypothetical protein